MEDSGILVSMHASDSGYSRYQGDWTGPQEMLPFRPDAFRMMTHGKRAIEDTMSALVCHGVLTRFPDLKIAAVENGGDWVVPFLEHLEDTYRKMPHAFDEDPIVAFKRNISISPFHEDKIDKLIEAIGVGPRAVRVGLSRTPRVSPSRARTSTTCRPGSPDDDLEAIMGGNLGRLMRVPVAA